MSKNPVFTGAENNRNKFKKFKKFKKKLKI